MSADDGAAMQDTAGAARRLAEEIDEGTAAKNHIADAESLEAKVAHQEVTPTRTTAAALPFGEAPIARAGAALKLGLRRAVWAQRLGEETAMKQQGSGFASFIAVGHLTGEAARGDHQSNQHHGNVREAIRFGWIQ